MLLTFYNCCWCIFFLSFELVRKKPGVSVRTHANKMMLREREKKKARETSWLARWITKLVSVRREEEALCLSLSLSCVSILLQQQQRLFF